MLWDFVISLIHTSTFPAETRHQLWPGRRIGSDSTPLHVHPDDDRVELCVPSLAVITAASSNYLINNILTFGDRRQKGRQLIKGLLKFLLVASLPLANGLGNKLLQHGSVPCRSGTACGNHRGLHLEWRSVISLCVEHTLNHGRDELMMVNRPGHARHQPALRLRLVHIWCPWQASTAGGKQTRLPWPGILLDPTRRSGCRRSGEGFTRIRGIGVSTVPLPYRSDLSAVRGSEWIGLSVLFSALTIWLSSDWVDAVQSSGRVVGWHG